MSPSDLTRSDPFRAALFVLAVFVVLYVLAGWALLQSVVTTLGTDLETRVEIETQLLVDVFEDGGQNALIGAIEGLHRMGSVSDRAHGLLDGDDFNLADPIARLPDVVGLHEQEISVLSDTLMQGQFLLRAHRLDSLTLVVGRSDAPIPIASSRLLAGLAALGGALALSTLFLGLRAG